MTTTASSQNNTSPEEDRTTNKDSVAYPHQHPHRHLHHHHHSKHHHHHRRHHNNDKETDSPSRSGSVIPSLVTEEGVVSHDRQGKMTTAFSTNDIEAATPAACDNHRGKLLEWSDVSMVVKSRNKKKQEKLILDHISGKARPGETTAIMGASGAGKTSLFHVLAGRIQHKAHLRIEGQVYLSHQLIDPSQRQVRLLFAYVAQHDTLHEPSTPREALAFSAKLRSGSTETVDSLIHELGLESVADTKISALSGGERRRTSIGIELVSNPSILLLDEPTSGLDSFAAKQVLGLLQKMARADNTVLFTIHQPSSDVFSSFDRLILLHKGRMMYQGLTRDIPMDYERMGYKVPNNYNPADWILVSYTA